MSQKLTHHDENKEIWLFSNILRVHDVNIKLYAPSNVVIHKNTQLQSAP